MTDTASTPWQRYADPERKRKFAALARQRPANRSGYFEAACLVFPDAVDDALALRATDEWPRDRIVIEEMARLAKAESAEELPTAEQQARDVYRLASDETKGIDDRLKAHKLYAEMRGHIKRPGDAGANVYIDNRRVMLMPPAANSVDDWESLATGHQAKLVNDASA
jgi:hypothetical protein